MFTSQTIELTHAKTGLKISVAEIPKEGGAGASQFFIRYDSDKDIVGCQGSWVSSENHLPEPTDEHPCQKQFRHGKSLTKISY